MAIEKLTKIILAVIAFVIIVVGILMISKNLYYNISLFFEKEKVLEESKPNIDILLRNMEACDDVNDELCICEIFPNFPSSLSKYFSISSININEKRNITINLAGRPIDYRKIKNSFGVFLVGKINFDSYDKNSKEFEINFEEFPKVKGYFKSLKGPKPIEISRYVVSPYVIKEKSIYFLALDEEFKDYAQEISKILNDKIKDFPKCKENRMEAINFFNNFIQKIKEQKQQQQEEQIEINLPEGFFINISNGQISLFNDEGIVKNISKLEDLEISLEDIYNYPRRLEYYSTSFKVKQLEKQIEEKWKSQEVRSSYNGCGEDLILKKGDKIKVSKENNKVCIKKIV
jgi:hypothetical protein